MHADVGPPLDRGMSPIKRARENAVTSCADDQAVMI